MSDLLNKWRQSLEKTRKATLGKIITVFGGSEIDGQTWDELEELLILADLGVETSQLVTEQLISAVSQQGITKTEDFQKALEDILLALLLPAAQLDIDNHHPAVITLVRVNGSGKKTTAAKLGYIYAKDGKKVMLAAAATFRAAAFD